MKGEDKDVRNKVTSYYVCKEGAVQLYMYRVVDLIHPLKLLLSPLSTLFFSEFFLPPVKCCYNRMEQNHLQIKITQTHNYFFALLN